MILALVRKDWRVYRPAAIGGAAVTVFPYAILLLRIVSNPQVNASFGAVAESAVLGLSLTGFVATAFGGAAFAVERRQRSAEFLAMLPVPRQRVVHSKLVVAASCLGSMFAFHTAVLAFATRGLQATSDAYAWDEFAQRLLVSLATVTAFGFAWMISSFVESAVVAACASIGFCIVASISAYVLLQDWSRTLFGRNVEWFVVGTYAGLAVTAGVVAIVVGRQIVLRRVAP